MIIEILLIASSLSLGLLIGSLLTEAFILVPYWREMDSEEFLKLHGSLGPKLYHYFAPLTILGTIIPIAAAVIPIVLGAPVGLSIIPAVLVSTMLVIYFAYFKGANLSFETGSVGVDGVAEQLRRWALWHWVRVGIGLLAFDAA
mgnify:CR=1 FL=1